MVSPKTGREVHPHAEWFIINPLNTTNGYINHLYFIVFVFFIVRRTSGIRPFLETYKWQSALTTRFFFTRSWIDTELCPIFEPIVWLLLKYRFQRGGRWFFLLHWSVNFVRGCQIILVIARWHCLVMREHKYYLYLLIQRA